MFWRHACNADRCAGSERNDTASKKRALITGIHALRFQVVQGVRMILELVGALASIRDGHAGQVPSTFLEKIARQSFPPSGCLSLPLMIWSLLISCTWLCSLPDGVTEATAQTVSGATTGGTPGTKAARAQGSQTMGGAQPTVPLHQGRTGTRDT